MHEAGRANHIDTIGPTCEVPDDDRRVAYGVKDFVLARSLLRYHGYPFWAAEDKLRAQ